ncbi:acyl-CoA dehydrogenase family protein [Bacillus cereus]
MGVLLPANSGIKEIIVWHSHFVETEEQSLIIEKINKLIPKFMEREHQLSELGSFPYENINDLKDIGYTKLTLPKEFGGSAISLYDFVLFQEKIAEGCGATALSIGWHLGIVKGASGKSLLE